MSKCIFCGCDKTTWGWEKPGQLTHCRPCHDKLVELDEWLDEFFEPHEDLRLMHSNVNREFFMKVVFPRLQEMGHLKVKFVGQDEIVITPQRKKEVTVVK
jgi:hypothetical protein